MKSYLNTTLARWMAVQADVPDVDCRGCTKLTKCCAFQPFVPNFLLGGWLVAQNKSGLPQHKSLEFQPLGAIATADYRSAHDRSENREKDTSLLCAFYNNGGCSIWDFRPGECSTYFCDEGMKSEARQSLSQDAFSLEIAVSQMALVEMGFSPEEISAQIDACNGQPFESRKYPDEDLISMYKQSWNWSRQLTSDQIASWLE